MRHMISRRRRVSAMTFLLTCAIFTGVGLLILAFKSLDPSTAIASQASGVEDEDELEQFPIATPEMNSTDPSDSGSSRCATVEKMGEDSAQGVVEASLRIRRIIRNHFALQGASRIRGLPPEQFCRQGFVLGKASEAGFGNEMYKILTGAALSIMLNRSLIIGQTRHIGSPSSLCVLYLRMVLNLNMNNKEDNYKSLRHFAASYNMCFCLKH